MLAPQAVDWIACLPSMPANAWAAGLQCLAKREEQEWAAASGMMDGAQMHLQVKLIHSSRKRLRSGAASVKPDLC